MRSTSANMTLICSLIHELILNNQIYDFSNRIYERDPFSSAF